MTKHQSCLHLVPIFNHLDDSSMQLIAKKIKHQSFKKGYFLFQAGDQTDKLYVVHKGSIKIYRLLANGREQVVKILKTGDFIGETSIFKKDTYHEDYAEILEDSEVCVIEQKDLTQILKDYPEISLKIIEQMSKRLNDSYKQTTQVTTESIGVRLAMYLVDLVNSDSESPTVTLPTSRKNIAYYLGTTPESISRKFKELEEKGLIIQESSSVIKIIDLDDLIYYSE